MSVLYLLTAPSPVMAGTDAVFNEVAALRDAFGGEAVNLYPLQRPGRPYPRPLYGFHVIRRLKALQDRHAINHVFFPILYPFPVLRFLRKPCVYTVTAGLDKTRKPGGLMRLSALHRIVVSNDRDAAVLQSWGVSNVAVIMPGIERPQPAVAPPAPLPVGTELTLLMASSPWVRGQFDSKGVDVLLEAAARLPFLKLILLWRGVLAQQLAARVARLGIAARVEIVDRRVNVNDYLRQAHAAVLLAKAGDVVRSYPHSLMESLVAGRPVLVSDRIAMADYVRTHGCGIVLPEVSVDALAAAVDALRQRYRDFARNAARIGSSAFAMPQMIEGYRRAYGN